MTKKDRFLKYSRWAHGLKGRTIKSVRYYDRLLELVFDDGSVVNFCAENQAGSVEVLPVQVMHFDAVSGAFNEAPATPAEKPAPECSPEAMDESAIAIRSGALASWTKRSILESGGALVFMSAHEPREPDAWFPTDVEPIEVHQAGLLLRLARNIDEGSIKSFWVVLEGDGDDIDDS